jgi:uncharacterized membrane protein YfcA
MSADFDWARASVIFLAYCSIDWLFTLYTLSIVNKEPMKAANVGIGLYILSAFGVISYVEDWRYVIPMCVGGWLGTYFSVRREKQKADKQRQE